MDHPFKAKSNARRSLFFSLLLLAILALPAPVWQRAVAAVTPSSALSAAEREASSRVTAAAIREITSALTAPEMQGRGTATPGGEKAAKYLAAQFEKLGLKPLGDHESYLQAVKFKAYSIAPEASVKVGDAVLKFGSDFVVAPPVTFDQVDLTAPVVFAGYGVVASALQRDDLAGLDLKGKLVIVLQGRPKNVAEAEWSKVSNPQTIVGALLSRGIAGLVFANIGTEERPFSLISDYLSRRRVELAETPQSPFKLPPILAVSDAGAGKLLSGSGSSYAELKARAENGENVSKMFDRTAAISIRVTREEGIGSNVAGVLEGADPALKQEAVVYTAHYDAYGVGADGRIYPGAADDALGVGTMLGIATAFARGPEPPKRSVIFLAVTGEEYGLLGAAYWVNHPTWPIEKVAADINFDGIGTEIYGPVKNVVGFGAEHSELGKTFEDVLEANGLKLAPDPMPEEKAFYRSDHYEFVKKGVPALMLLGAPDGPPQQYIARAKKWLVTDYHQTSDTVRPDWNWEGPRTMAVVGLVVGMRVANADRMPAWLASSPFNRERGTNAPPPPRR